MAENVISTSLNIGIKALLVLSTAIAIGLPRAYASEPEPIRVAAGAQFDVELEWDTSTDCQWLLSKPLDQKLIAVVGKPRYRRTQLKAGAGTGREVLTFKALAEGKTQIHLKYDRLWGKTPAPLRSTNFVVVISAPEPNPTARK